MIRDRSHEIGVLNRGMEGDHDECVAPDWGFKSSRARQHAGPCTAPGSLLCRPLSGPLDVERLLGRQLPTGGSSS